MSDKHLMFCNLIAWKEGNDYVFEDGSKAYPFLDNDERFNNYTLMPDWVVEGLVGTPFYQFVFMYSNHSVKSFGIAGCRLFYDKCDFEENIGLYRYENLKAFIGTCPNCCDTGDVIKEIYSSGFITENGLWYHFTEVVEPDNKWYLCCDLQGELGIAENEIRRMHISGRESTRQYIASRFGTASVCMSPYDIKAIKSGLYFNQRPLYLNGYLKCSIYEFNNNGTVNLHFADSDKTEYNLSLSAVFENTEPCLFARTYGYHVMPVEEVDDSFRVVFSDFSESVITKENFSNGMVYHEDVIKALELLGIMHLDCYFYVKDFGWVFTIGKNSYHENVFLGYFDFDTGEISIPVGSKFHSLDDVLFCIIGINKTEIGNVVYDISFNNEDIRTGICGEDILACKVLYSSCSDSNSCENEFTYYTAYGLGYNIEDIDTETCRVFFEDGTSRLMSVERVSRQGSIIIPKLFSETTRKDCICCYNSKSVRSLYFDRSESCYILLDYKYNLYKVQSDGSKCIDISHIEGEEV